MQPTLPQQTGGIADMDLTAVQSMDWLFKKERIYLLAQFWQQRATLAEKEVNTLKEQLSSCSDLTTTASTQFSTLSPTSTTASPIICQESQISSAVNTTVPISTITSIKNYNKLSSPIKLINSSSGISINIPSPPPSQNNNIHQPQYQLQNGGLLAEAPSPSPPLSDSGNTTPASCTKTNSIINNNCNHNNLRVNRKLFNKMADTNDSTDSNNSLTTATADMQITVAQIIKNNNNNNNNEDRIKDTSSHSPKIDKIDNIDDDDSNCNINNINNNNNNNSNKNTSTSDHSNNDNNNLSNIQNNNKNNSSSNSTRSLTDELAAKDKEIKILIDKVSRLQALHEQHIEEIQKLKENLNGKIQLITNLESQLKITNEDDSESKLPKPIIKEEKDEISPMNSPIPASVTSVCADPKKFQEILLERTKVLAATQQINEKRNIYNSDESTFTSNDINKNVTNSYKSSSPEPSTIPTISLIDTSIDYLSDTPNFKSNNSNKNDNYNIESLCTDTGKNNNSKKDEEFNKNNLTSEHIKETSDLTSVPENFHNVEQFGTMLGEELIKKYWHHNFDIPPINSSNNNSLPILPNENLQHNNTILSLKSDDGGLNKCAPLSDVATTTNKTGVLSQYQNIIPTTSTLGPSPTTLLSKLVNSTFSNSLRTDNTCISSTNNSHNHFHQDMDKSSGRNSTASTPNDGRHSTDDHSVTGVMPSGILNPLNLNKNNCNEDTLGSLSHMPANFIPGLPSFQFQDRNHFRFSEDMPIPGSMTGRLGESLIPKGDPMEAKLQEMLRYNMDKYANQNLDTLHISRRVRELLSVHNIGQRLFAKYVLGLSQGTVSELLSKPKPWDKLTEKGRDSYRKMHAWACDDTAVLLLKSLIPKKGSDPGMPQYSRSDESMSDDRIAHILSEASQMIKNPTSLSSNMHPQQMHHPYHQQHSLTERSSERDDLISNEDSKSPIPSQCQSPTFKENQLRQRKNEEMSQDKMAKIYQEELAKIMSRSQLESFPSGGAPPNAQQMPDDNIRVALEAYHRELSKLQQTGGNIPNFPNLSGLLALQHQAATTLNGSAQDLSISKEKEFQKSQEQFNGQINCPSEQSDQNTKDSLTSEDQRHSSAFSLVRPKQEPGNQQNHSSAASVGTPSAAASPLGNSILPPAMTPTDDFSSAASPLQRMASITNSLITQPPVTPHHSQPQRPMKAVLPPITQQQFDMFNNLNTEDIVRRVKEALSQYSISQRLFGESVLGLSQGSVSDLLARPKPWHMLTQKGREPFIRMKMFLEDDNAVHKLVASQYKIAPEKLMRTGNYSGSPQIPTGLANKMGNMANMANLPMQKIMNELKMQENTPQHIMQQMQASVMAHMPTVQHQGMLLTPPGMPPHHAISLPNSAEKKPMMLPVQSSPQANAMRGMHQHMSPTVYEMAALTQDLDTQIITTKIKEALLANNIGQKIFGEAVLGLSQGSVSELLSKPKPWHMLSIKGREPFIRMQLWLSDGNNVERLQLLKNERREASKRRRSTGPGGNHDNSSDTSSNDTADFYTSSPGPGSVGSAGAPPNKKQRVLFSEEQKEALRLAFALDPYPNVATIEFLANELNLATRTITNWFHNHRMRLKQQVPHGAPSEPMPSRENPPATPFDPVQFRILLNQRLVELQKDRMGISGIPIPYPPYFAANPNLAALIGRGLLPTNESELQALNAAFREQMNGLDLSMASSVKRERDDEFDDEIEPDNDNDISDTESIEGDAKSDNQKEESYMSMALGLQSRTSRRKPAAPQWVNPDWQEGVTGIAPVDLVKNQNNKSDKEVIINGVCVMQQQADDYTRKSDDVDPSSVAIQSKETNDIIGNGNESTKLNNDCEKNTPKDKDNDSVTTDDIISTINIQEDNKTDTTDNDNDEFSINEKTHKLDDAKNSEIWKY